MGKRKKGKGWWQTDKPDVRNAVAMVDLGKNITTKHTHPSSKHITTKKGQLKGIYNDAAAYIASGIIGKPVKGINAKRDKKNSNYKAGNSVKTKSNN